MSLLRLARLMLLSALVGVAQTLVWLQLEPPVIVPGSTSTLIVQVRVNGSPTRVTFESALQLGTEVNMKDDGTGGDLVAGDGIYTITLPAAQIVGAMRPDDVYRPLLGYVRPYSGTTAAGRYNVLAEVADPKIPRLPVVSDAPDVQHTDYVVNIVSPQSFPPNSAPSAIPNQAKVTNRFFSLFPDAYEVINVVYVPSFFQNRFHYQVRNAVIGIGSSIFDGGASYGSPSHLLGISVFPLSTFFDGADSGVQHEFGHQWINYLNVPPVAVGIPHWPLSTMASGTMGFSITGGEGGNFPCLLVPDPSGVRLVNNPNQPMFGDLDLYLMGLLPSNQVGEQLILANQDFNSVLSQCNGSIYTGTFTRIHVSDLSANPSIGPRVPDSALSPKQFRLATIVVTPDSLLSPEAMSFYSFFAQRMELQTAVLIHQGLLKATGYPFAVSARGLGTMVAKITASAPPSVALSSTSLQFVYTLGGAVPVGLPVQITNGGDGTLSWIASSSVNWLSVTPSSGTAPSTLTIALNASATSLAAGTSYAPTGSWVDRSS